MTPSSCSVDHSLAKARCKFSCDPGFRLVGAKLVRCRRNSAWKSNGGKPKCVKMVAEDAGELVVSVVADNTTMSTTSTTATPNSYFYTPPPTTTTLAPFSKEGAMEKVSPFVNEHQRPHIYCPPDATRQAMAKIFGQ